MDELSALGLRHVGDIFGTGNSCTSIDCASKCECSIPRHPTVMHVHKGGLKLFSPNETGSWCYILGGYGIPIELFAPFTDSCVVVMKRLIESMANAKDHDKDHDKAVPRPRSAPLGFCPELNRSGSFLCDSRHFTGTLPVVLKHFCLQHP